MAFWELEFPRIMVKPEQWLKTEKSAVLAQVSETLELRNGQYRIGNPWKEEETKFTNNYALVQLKSKEKSLKQRGAEVMGAYNKIFQHYKRNA